MNWRNWTVPGLAVTLAAAAVSVFIKTAPMDGDLAARLSEALHAQGHDWAAVSVYARDAVLSGVAPEPEGRESAVRAAHSVRGVRTVANNTTVVPLVVSYTWSARRAVDGLVISGHVPSEAAKAAVLSTARDVLLTGQISDGMSIARG